MCLTVDDVIFHPFKMSLTFGWSKRNEMHSKRKTTLENKNKAANVATKKQETATKEPGLFVPVIQISDKKG